MEPRERRRVEKGPRPRLAAIRFVGNAVRSETALADVDENTAAGCWSATDSTLSESHRKRLPSSDLPGSGIRLLRLKEWRRCKRRGKEAYAFS